MKSKELFDEAADLVDLAIKRNESAVGLYPSRTSFGTYWLLDGMTPVGFRCAIRKMNELKLDTTAVWEKLNEAAFELGKEEARRLAIMDSARSKLTAEEAKECGL